MTSMLLLAYIYDINTCNEAKNVMRLHYIFYVLYCSWHQTTNFVFPNFSTNFSQLEQFKKKANFLLVQNRFFLSFGPMKSLFSFSTAKIEKKSWKKLGKKIGGLVVWCHEQYNLVNVFFQMSLDFKPRLLLSALCYSKISTICHFQDSEKRLLRI